MGKMNRAHPSAEDELVFNVESISEHRGEGRKMQFLVRWEGYDPSQDSWEPIRHLRNNTVCQAYIQKHFGCLQQPKLAATMDINEGSGADSEAGNDDNDEPVVKRRKASSHCGDAQHSTEEAVTTQLTPAEGGFSRAFARTTIAGRNVHCTRMAIPSSKPHGRLVDYMFGTGKIVIFEFPISGNKLSSVDQAVPKGWLDPCTFSMTDHNGCNELLCVTMEDDAGSGGYQWVKGKKLQVVMVLTERPGELEQKLLQLADFSALGPRKAASRVKLLLSESKNKELSPIELSAEDFEVVDELMSAVTGKAMAEGIGFVPDHYLAKLLPNLSPAKLKNVLGIQMRVFAPLHGVFKGMLMRMPPGPQQKGKIQLTLSMRKVPPSTLEGVKSYAFVVVKASFPSKPSRLLSKWYSSETRLKSFELNPLSGKGKKAMVGNLLTSLGVPAHVIEEYDEEGKTGEKPPCHAYLIGLADSTRALPAGHIFLTGLTANFVKLPEKVFVTRSPCVLPEHGRLLPLVRSRPKGMSGKDWQFLCSLPVGGCIFSTAGGDFLPSIPSQVADGDLDGDLYLALWHNGILNQIKERPLPSPVAKKKTSGGVIGNTDSCGSSSGGSNSSSSRSSGISISSSSSSSSSSSGSVTAPRGKWLRDASALMMDPSFLGELTLIGPLYKAAQRVYEQEGSMDHEDYRAYMQAYLQVLDMGKHGGKISLSSRLRKEAGIPEEEPRFTADHTHVRSMLRVAKEFQGIRHYGTVVAFAPPSVPTENDQLYRVKYEDDDEEDWDEQELRRGRKLAGRPELHKDDPKAVAVYKRAKRSDGTKDPEWTEDHDHVQSGLDVTKWFYGKPFRGTVVAFSPESKRGMGDQLYRVKFEDDDEEDWDEQELRRGRALAGRPHKK